MIERLEDRFAEGLNPLWRVAEVGQGSVTPSPGSLRLTVAPSPTAYSNAQIADYDYDDFNFNWQPPLRLTVTAWVTSPVSDLRGTAGFGFWNHPFSPDSRRLRLPQAIWFFFAAPPSDMALAAGVPGHGWKAATIDAGRRSALEIAPLALPATLLMQIPTFYQRIYPHIQRRLAVAEHLIDLALLGERHTYTLDWRSDGADFGIDGASILQTPYAPRGRAGFVAWLDNQYAVVTPQGKLRFGIVPVTREQTLVLESIVIESLNP